MGTSSCIPRQSSPLSDRGAAQSTPRFVSPSPALLQAAHPPPEFDDNGLGGDDHDMDISDEDELDQDSGDDAYNDPSYDPESIKPKTSVTQRIRAARRAKHASKVITSPKNVVAGPASPPNTKVNRTRRKPRSSLSRANSRRERRQRAMIWCSHTECKWAFDNKRDLARHEAVHNGLGRWQCMLCGKVLSRYDAGLRHSKGHTGQEPDLMPYTDSDDARVI
ncbi:hypothetical protein EVJ58_g10703 [Rhodofomes roseus]|uniref:C2H2-type domain-containing protein n=1 Tax=Rhodofomes roseus TaxID=34475 RepID=A0A4Y9XM70_9APHY|nr:hypothetical protein EVJ58_g10703 [Rhodofomes roseus]